MYTRKKKSLAKEQISSYGGVNCITSVNTLIKMLTVIFIVILVIWNEMPCHFVVVAVMMALIVALQCDNQVSEVHVHVNVFWIDRVFSNTISAIFCTCILKVWDIGIAYTGRNNVHISMFVSSTVNFFQCTKSPLFDIQLYVYTYVFKSTISTQQTRVIIHNF